MKHECLRSLTSTDPYVVTERVEVIAGLMYTAVVDRHRIQAVCGHRTLWAGTAGYRHG